MKIYNFSTTVAKAIDLHGSQDFSYSRILEDDGQFRVGCAWLDGNGSIGAHPAGHEQLLLVLAGSGIVSGSGATSVEVAPGSAVFWQAEEIHETRALESGLVAIIIQGQELRSALAMDILPETS